MKIKKIIIWDGYRITGAQNVEVYNRTDFPGFITIYNDGNCYILNKDLVLELIPDEKQDLL